MKCRFSLLVSHVPYLQPAVAVLPTPHVVTSIPGPDTVWNTWYDAQHRESVQCSFPVLFFHCCSITVVCIYPLLLPPNRSQTHPPPLLLPSPWFCPCVLYSCSWASLFFHPQNEIHTIDCTWLRILSHRLLTFRQIKPIPRSGKPFFIRCSSS